MFDISCCGLSVESGNVYTVYDKVINNVNTSYNLFSLQFSHEITMLHLYISSIAMTHIKSGFMVLRCFCRFANFRNQQKAVIMNIYGTFKLLYIATKAFCLAQVLGQPSKQYCNKLYLTLNAIIVDIKFLPLNVLFNFFIMA